MRRALTFAAILIVTVAIPSTASAKTFEVTRTDDPVPDRCRPTDCSLREAVIAANARGGRDRVSLDKKTYVLELPGPFGENAGRNGDLDLNGGTSIYGPRSGRARISGLPAETTIHAKGDESVTLEGLVIRDAEPGDDDYEAGVSADVPQLVISHSRISGSSVGVNAEDRVVLRRSSVSSNSKYGVYGFSALVDHSRIVGNGNPDNPDYALGGISTCGKLRIVDSLVARNISESSDTAGGIQSGDDGSDCINPKLFLRRSRVVANEGMRLGNSGGLAAAGGPTRIYDSLIARNEGGGDGGLLMYGRIEGSVIRKNVGATIGGGSISGRIDQTTIADNTGALGGLEFNGSMTRSTVSGNRGTDSGSDLFTGGGLQIVRGTSIANSTLAENSTAGAGGGISAHRGALTLTNVTIARNRADARGGGIAATDRGPDIALRNSIVADNVATRSPECAARVRSNGANVLTGASEGCRGLTRGDRTAGDPRLGKLSRNGGPTDTIALLRGSPAIGKASARLAPERDQRGVERRNPDAGAFERR